MARAAMSLPSRPAVVFVGFMNWCAGRRESQSHIAHARKETRNSRNRTYLIAAIDQNDCPSGWDRLTNAEACRTAASELGLRVSPYDAVFINLNNLARPNGCFRWFSGSVHFNNLTDTLPAGPIPIRGAPVCKSRIFTDSVPLARKLTHARADGNDCISGLHTTSNIPSRDRTGESVRAVALHYSMTFISIFDSLAPLIRTNHSIFSPPILFTHDGVHGRWKNSDAFSLRKINFPPAYYVAVGEMLVAFFDKALREWLLLEVTKEADASAQLPELMASLVLYRNQVGQDRVHLICYEWLRPRILPPSIVRNISSPENSGSRGWFVSEFTLHGAEAKRKPGLVSLARGDTIDLQVDLAAASRHTCVSMVYLRSYEHMGSVHLSCLPPCKCVAVLIDALNTSHKASTFETAEITAISSSTRCVLRFTNLGALHAHLSGVEEQAKFRLAGLFTQITERTSSLLGGNNTNPRRLIEGQC